VEDGTLLIFHPKKTAMELALKTLFFSVLISIHTTKRQMMGTAN
jgi:hypothetical protein